MNDLDQTMAQATELSRELADLSLGQQIDAMSFLWGTMAVRDPQACRDALLMATGREK